MATGGTAIFKELIVVRDNAKKALTVATKEATKAAKNDNNTKKSLIKKYRLSTKINNMRYRLNVKCIQLALNAAAAMTKTAKDDDKALQNTLKKNGVPAEKTLDEKKQAILDRAKAAGRI